jgi:hypothetical protein
MHILGIHENPDVLKNIIDCVETKLTSFIFTRMGRTNISNDSIFAQKCSIGKDNGPHPAQYYMT